MNTQTNSAEKKDRLSRHSVKNLVVSCIDFRFTADMHKAIFDTFGVDDFDEIKMAGGGGNLAHLATEERKKTLLDDISLAINAHGVENVYILTHQNCGAYAKSGKAFPKELSDEEKDYHCSELCLAHSVLAELFPKANIFTAFAHVDPADDSVHLLKA